MLNKKLLSISAALCLISLVLIGCSEKIVNNKTDSNVAISISFKASDIGASSALAEIFILTVEAEDIPMPLMFPLTLEGSYLNGEAIVPIGVERHFIISAYDDLGTMIYQGDNYANVVADSTVTVLIDLFPVVPMLKAIPRIVTETGRLRIDSLAMGESFVVDVYAYNVPGVRYISFDLSYLTNNFLINFFDVGLGADVPADSRVSYEGSGSSVTIWLDRPNLGGPLVDALGNAHLLTFYFSSHGDTADDFDTTTIEITPSILERGSGDVTDPFPLESLYLESSSVALYRDANF